MSRRNKSFVWGGVTATVLFILGIATGNILPMTIIALTGFTLVSCLILDNNFIGEMISEIFSWGFVRFPGLIFTLDLDGIIWLITVKLLFWVLGFLIAALFGLLAVSLGLVLSIFVYPFALAKNIRSGEKTIRGSRRRMSTVNPLKSTPSCVSDRGTIYRICPHCGDTVTTSVCSMCGKKNHLFD